MSEQRRVKLTAGRVKNQGSVDGIADVLSGRCRHLDKAIRRPNRSNTISGFAFVDIAAFRRSKSMSKPNFVDISQLMDYNYFRF